jgi:hypothetical protein
MTSLTLWELKTSGKIFCKIFARSNILINGGCVEGVSIAIFSSQRSCEGGITCDFARNPYSLTVRRMARNGPVTGEQDEIAQ